VHVNLRANDLLCAKELYQKPELQSCNPKAQVQQAQIDLH